MGELIAILLAVTAQADGACPEGQEWVSGCSFESGCFTGCAPKNEHIEVPCGSKGSARVISCREGGRWDSALSDYENYQNGCEKRCEFVPPRPVDQANGTIPRAAALTAPNSNAVCVEWDHSCGPGCAQMDGECLRYEERNEKPKKSDGCPRGKHKVSSCDESGSDMDEKSKSGDFTYMNKAQFCTFTCEDDE